MKLLRAAALLCIAIVLGSRFVGYSVPARAQSVAIQSLGDSGNAPKFASVSVNEDNSPDKRISIKIGDGTDAVEISKVPLLLLMVLLYQLPANQIVGLPKWADTQRFNIEATVEGSATPSQRRLMLQAFLAERFKLMVRRERTDFPVYALVMATPGKLGPRLRPYSSDETCDQSNSSDPSVDAIPCEAISVTPVKNGTRYAGRKLTVEQFVKLVSGANPNISHPILDRTNLGGLYDLSLEFGSVQPGSPSDPSAVAGPISIFDAVQDQLGLKLEPQIAPVDVLLVDHVETLSPN